MLLITLAALTVISNIIIEIICYLLQLEAFEAVAILVSTVTASYVYCHAEENNWLWWVITFVIQFAVYTYLPKWGTYKSTKQHGSWNFWTTDRPFIYGGGDLTEFQKKAVRYVMIHLPSFSDEIPRKAFEDCCGLRGIEEIKVGKYSVIKKVRSLAFHRCHELEYIELPDSIECIEKAAFAGCSSLRTIKLPRSIQKIEDSAFAGCTGVTNIIFPAWDIHTKKKSTTSDDNGGGPTSTTTVPTKKLQIRWQAFMNCSSLQSLNLQSVYIEEIPPYAFSHCSSLEEINLPKYLRKIGKSAFQSCLSITDLSNLPDSVEEIDDFAFRRCSHLKVIVIPNSMKELHEGVFESCTSLEVVQFPRKKNCDGRYNDDGDKSMPNNNAKTDFKLFHKIGPGAFNGCLALSHIDIPDSVQILGERCFFCCTALKSIKFPDSIERVGLSAFYGCHALRTITVPRMMQYHPIVIYYVNNDGTINSDMNSRYNDHTGDMPENALEPKKKTFHLPNFQFHCDVNRIGRRFLMETATANSSKHRSYASSALWPYIFYRGLNTVKFPYCHHVRILDANRWNEEGAYCSTEPDIRVFSVIYHLLINGAVEDLCYR